MLMIQRSKNCFLQKKLMLKILEHIIITIAAAMLNFLLFFPFICIFFLLSLAIIALFSFISLSCDQYPVFCFISFCYVFLVMYFCFCYCAMYVTRHISNQMFIIREVNSDMPAKYRTNAGTNPMSRAEFEPKRPRSHERCSNHWATEATTAEWVKY